MTERAGNTNLFLPKTTELEGTMADNVNEESDYVPGKDELDWGYEEGRLVSACTRWDAESQSLEGGAEGRQGGA